MTLTMNIHQELCGLQKGGGNALSLSDITKCARIAAVKTEALNTLLQTTLEQFWNARKRKRTVIPVGFTQIPDEIAPSITEVRATVLPPTLSSPAPPSQQSTTGKKTGLFDGTGDAWSNDSKTTFPDVDARKEFEEFASKLPVTSIPSFKVAIDEDEEESSKEKTKGKQT